MTSYTKRLNGTVRTIMNEPEVYYVQHIKGNYLSGWRKVYTPHPQWVSTWNKSPQVGRTYTDAMEALDMLSSREGVVEVHTVKLEPV